MELGDRFSPNMWRQHLSAYELPKPLVIIRLLTRRFLPHLSDPIFRSAVLGLTLILIMVVSLVEVFLLMVFQLIRLALIMTWACIAGAELSRWLFSDIPPEHEHGVKDKAIATHQSAQKKPFGT
jgi:hypothetical protein